MSVGNNFVDLRITSAGVAGDSEDSVWPAFTDIMMVVLMIFLISMVTFLVRNTQLVDELQTTLIQKDQISEKALLSAEQNQSLASQLALVRQQILSLEDSLQSVKNRESALEQTLAQREQAARDLETEISLLTKLRDQLSDSNSTLLSKLDISQKTTLQTQMELDDTQNTLNEKISLLLAEKAGLIITRDEKQQALSKSKAEQITMSNRIIALTGQLKLINEQLDDKTTQNEALSEKVQDQGNLMAGLSNSKEELEARLEMMAEQLSKLKNLFDSQNNVVTELQTRILGKTNQYKNLQEEYDSLDDKYKKLIRPARNTAGKYVVRVIFAKQNAKSLYQIQEPDQAVPQILDLDALNAKLAELKVRHGQSLYTKVRIDEQSGIGFNEAWRFTQQILSKYDYYHNDFSEFEPTEEVQ